MRKHLTETNLTYWQHCKYGMMHARKSCYVVWTSFWHAIWPGWYPYVAEKILEKQYKLLEVRRKDRLEHWVKQKTKGK